ncbi:hypothetical protein BK147_19340 [Paenibacillus sp. FSL R7-0337]|nr:hypothetical protein BK147_19340 [Paenibacillus sp. FSL R7-0337]
MLLSILQGTEMRRGMLALEARHSSGKLNGAAFECPSIHRSGDQASGAIFVLFPLEHLGVRLPQRLIAQRVLSGIRTVREGIRL